jgi:hypothetical protein
VFVPRILAILEEAESSRLLALAKLKAAMQILNRLAAAIYKSTFCIRVGVFFIIPGRCSAADEDVTEP